VSVYVSGNYAYVASEDSYALEIVDIGTVSATGVNVVSANQINCTFNLNSKATGLYTVVVTNPDGKFGTLSSGFTIIAADAPVAGFISNVTFGTSPLTVQFTDTSTTFPASWNWSFGDGSYSTLQNPSHTFTRGGIYTVSLNVTNAQGTDTLTRRDYIGVIVTLNDGIAIFRPEAGYWYFDNNLDAVINSSFRYGGSTDQIIKGDWQGSGRDGIAIFRPEAGYWYFDYNLDGRVDNSFRYGGIGDQIITGDWQGSGRDGIAIFRPEAGYWYFDYNLDGLVDKSFRYGGSNDQIIVGKWISVAPTAAFVANTTFGSSPLSVLFTDQSTGSPISWYWSFGDGTTSLLQNPVHTYTSPKKTQSYTVILTVSNAFGSTTVRKNAYIMMSK